MTFGGASGLWDGANTCAKFQKYWASLSIDFCRFIQKLQFKLNSAQTITALLLKIQLRLQYSSNLRCVRVLADVKIIDRFVLVAFFYTLLAL